MMIKENRKRLKDSQLNNIKKHPINDSLTRLMSFSNQSIKMPPAPPFLYKFGDADKWSIPQVLKYLKDVMELEQYQDNFMRSEINGYAFICLSEDNMTDAMKMTDQLLHSLKILDHAENLRQKVYEKNVTELPTEFKSWSSIHIASFLSILEKCPNAGLYVLTSKLDGKQFSNMNPSDLVKAFPTNQLNSTERTNSIRAIEKKLFVKGFKTQIDDNISESNSIPEKPEVKKQTAMKRRRESDSNLNNSSELEIISEKPTIRQSTVKRVLPIIVEDEIDDDIDDELPPPFYDDNDNDNDLKSPDYIENNDLNDNNNESESENELEIIEKPIIKKKSKQKSNPESEIIKHRQQQQQQPQILQNSIDFAQIETDRKEFIQKLTKLQNTVTKQSKSIEKLQNITKTLQTSNKTYQNTVKTLERDKNIAKEMIDLLEFDRNNTLLLVNDINNKYLKQIEIEKNYMKDNILNQLFVPNIQTNQDMNTQRNNHNNTDDDLTGDFVKIEYQKIIPNLPPPNNATQSPEVKKPIDIQPQIDNKLIQSNDPKLFTETKLKVITDELNHKQIKKEVNVISSIKPLEEAIDKLFDMKIIDETNNNESNNSNVNNNESKNSVKKKRRYKLDDINMIKLLNEDGKLEYNVWTEIMNTYCYHDVITFSIDDSRLCLNRIALLWVRLGSRIIYDINHNLKSFSGKYKLNSLID